MYLTLVFVFSFMNEKKENGPRRAFPDKENPLGTLKWWAATDLSSSLYSVRFGLSKTVTAYSWQTCSHKLWAKNMCRFQPFKYALLLSSLLYVNVNSTHLLLLSVGWTKQAVWGCHLGLFVIAFSTHFINQIIILLFQKQNWQIIW